MGGASHNISSFAEGSLEISVRLHDILNSLEEKNPSQCLIGMLSWVIPWNLDLTKCQGTEEIGFVISRFMPSGYFSIHFTITGLTNMVSLYRGLRYTVVR